MHPPELNNNEFGVIYPNGCSNVDSPKIKFFNSELRSRRHVGLYITLMCMLPNSSSKMTLHETRGILQFTGCIEKLFLTSN